MLFNWTCLLVLKVKTNWTVCCERDVVILFSKTRKRSGFILYICTYKESTDGQNNKMVCRVLYLCTNLGYVLLFISLFIIV